ncbi:hypothetical protein L3X09_08000 [Enterococcus faecium]|nr:hypothetical protein [Enterococcus faecium]
MNKRKTEFILILISGITGILCSLLALMGGMFLSSIDSTTLNTTELTSKDIDMLVNLSGMLFYLEELPSFFDNDFHNRFFSKKKSKNSGLWY